MFEHLLSAGTLSSSRRMTDRSRYLQWQPAATTRLPYPGPSSGFPSNAALTAGGQPRPEQLQRWNPPCCSRWVCHRGPSPAEMCLSVCCHGYWPPPGASTGGTSVCGREADRWCSEAGWTVLRTPLWGRGHFEWPCLREDSRLSIHRVRRCPTRHTCVPVCHSPSHLTVTQTSKNGAQVQESQLPPSDGEADRGRATGGRGVSQAAAEPRAAGQTGLPLSPQG